MSYVTVLVQDKKQKTVHIMEPSTYERFRDLHSDITRDKAPFSDCCEFHSLLQRTVTGQTNAPIYSSVDVKILKVIHEDNPLIRNGTDELTKLAQDEVQKLSETDKDILIN